MTTHLIWHGREAMSGEEIDLPDDVAARFVATKQAELVEQPKAPAIESAHLDRSQYTAKRDMRPPQSKRR